MMGAMDRLRGPGRVGTRWMAAGVAVVAAMTFLVAALMTSATRPPGLPDGSARPSGGPPATGPVVYYEVLDADGSHLMERRLDGQSLARVVASRIDVDYGRTWIVDPAATIAIAAVPGSDEQTLDAVSVATGAAIWSTRTPSAPVDGAVWSNDGQRFALASVGSDKGVREAIVVDAATGRFVHTPIPDDAIVQGFDPDGGLILRQRLPSRQGVEVAWRFLRLDPGSLTIDRLATPPAVGPASDWSEDVAPAVGIGVDSTIGANDVGTAIRLWRLAGGPARILATLPSVDKVSIDPGGIGVAISAAQTIRFVTFAGQSSEVFSGPDPVADFAWSIDGDYLAVSTDRRGPNLTLVERSTGRSVELPHADAVAQLLLVRVLGGVPLPPTPLPSLEPAPSPTPAPSGPDVADFDGLLSSWVERTDTRQIVHVSRLAATESGGLRVVAEMPPLDLGPVPVPDDGGPEVHLLPRPASGDVLVWVDASERSAGWLWDGGAGLTPLDLPADWPEIAYDVAWRADGRAVAGSAGRVNARDEFEGIFVVAEIGGSRTTIVPIVGDYDRLEGWWSRDELRVGHGICTEGCEGRYASSARLRIADRRLVEMRVADRADAPIDEVVPDAGRGVLVLSVINDDPSDDVTVVWPAALGSLDAMDVVGFAADGRSLLVAVGVSDGTDLYRIDDPAGRAVDGRLADPAPERLVHLDRRGLRIEVSPDDGWAIVTDRVDNVRLVRLEDGRSWPVDRDRTLAWAAGR